MRLFIEESKNGIFCSSTSRKAQNKRSLNATISPIIVIRCKTDSRGELLNALLAPFALLVFIK